MKNSLKLVIVFLLLFVLGSNIVSAETETAKVDGEGATLYDGLNCSSNSTCTWMHYKSIGGKAAYCLNFNKTTPAGMGVTKNDSGYDEETLKDITAIIYESYSLPVVMPSSFSHQDEGHYRYFITELAINQRLKNKTSFNVASTSTENYIETLSNITAPEDQELRNFSDPTWHLQDLTNEDIKGDYLVTQHKTIYKFSISTATYTVTTSGVDNVIVVDENGNAKNKFKTGEGFFLKIPLSSIPSNGKATVTIKVNATAPSYTSYGKASVWVTDNGSDYQPLALPGEKITKTPSTPGPDGKINITLTTSASIQKVDADTGETISEAKLKVKDSKGNVIDEWTSSTSAHTVSNLTPGATYYLIETQAPDGYILNSTETSFVAEKDKTKVISMSNSKNVVKISKKDESNNLLEGAMLEIQDSKGNVVNYCTDAAGNKNKACKWESTKSQYEIKGMPAGSYYLVETKAPTGYVLNSEKINFTVEAGKEVKPITMSNRKNVVKISKKDESNNELKGATLEIQDKDGKIVNYCTDSDGNKKKPCKWVSTENQYEIEGMPAGTYYLVETIAPTGYSLSKERKEFVIKDTDEEINVTMENKLNLVKISKLDATGKNELKGATLEIQDKDGKIVNYCTDSKGNKNKPCKWVSTENQYEIEGMPAGIYYLVETIAPKGYVLNKEKVKFEVKESSKVVEVEMYNELETDVPDTMSNKSAILITLAMIILSLGIGIVAYIKKNKVIN